MVVDLLSESMNMWLLFDLSTSPRFSESLSSVYVANLLLQFHAWHFATVHSLFTRLVFRVTYDVYKKTNNYCLSKVPRSEPTYKRTTSQKFVSPDKKCIPYWHRG